MSINVIEDVSFVHVFVPKVIVLEFNLSYPESFLRNEEHWFIFNIDGSIRDCSTDSRETDLLALAAFAWRVRQMRIEVANRHS